MHLTSCETLVILITSIGEFLLNYSRFFYLFYFTLKEKEKKNNLLHDCFCVALFCYMSAFWLELWSNGVPREITTLSIPCGEKP